MEFPKTLFGFFGIHVPKAPCKNWDLEHIRCYQKSTLPLSEECALAMPLTEASPWLHNIILCAANVWHAIHQLLCCCYNCTIVDTTTVNIAAVLQLPLNSASVLLLALPLPTASALQTVVAATALVQYDASRCWRYDCYQSHAIPLKPLCCCFYCTVPPCTIPTLHYAAQTWHSSHYIYCSNTPLHQLTLVHPVTSDLGSRNKELIQEVGSSRILPICSSLELQL